MKIKRKTDKDISRCRPFVSAIYLHMKVIAVEHMRVFLIESVVSVPCSYGNDKSKNRMYLWLGVDVDNFSDVFYCPLVVGVNAPVKRFALAMSRGKNRDQSLLSVERYN